MACCSTSSLPKRSCFKYDAFLSFRGEDVRNTFIGHLHEALERDSIYTYKDDVEMERGEIIKDDLFKAIEESKFFIIVFSKDYASSTWCLNELDKIMECRRLNRHHQTAFPVFYDVDPSEVRRQTGPFAEAFAKHTNNEEADKWREALVQAGNLSGWDLKNTDDGHEAKLIKKITGEISLKLRTINYYINKKLVGMEARVEKVMPLLGTGVDDFRLIGIKGIGGGGKTTLARAVFNQISMEFEGKSFVENIRGKSQMAGGLQSLQEQVLSDVLLNDKSITVGSVDNGKSMIKKKLHCKKVLLVLDDVDHISQIEAFAEAADWFKPGSRIIITTTDEQVLIAHRVTRILDVELLSDAEAICLLSRHAFEKDSPPPGYRTLSRGFVGYAAGLPLVITVLGQFLCGKDGLLWMDQLERLRTTPLDGTFDVLKLSYDGLQEDLKEMFLDIACFLKSWHKDEVVRILEYCGFNPEIGLIVLEQKSLITFSDDQYLGMHQLIQKMGWNIVRRPPHDPEKHSRLWILKEIEDILAEDLGTDETRAIAVDDNQVELSSQIVTKGFRNMRKVRFLRVVSKEEDYRYVSQNLPNALQYLSWRSYPHRSLPNTFRANHLVALEMSDCKITQLWDGEETKALSMLRFLNLRRSSLRTLDLRLTPNLEKLDLKECRHLNVLHAPHGCVKGLISLNLSGCLSIQSFTFIKQFKSLKVLFLSRLDLNEFPDIIPGDCNSQLLELWFRHNDIEYLPSLIGNLKKLVHLDLHSCTKLKSLPSSICDLLHLRNLKLYGCMLEELPENIGRLACLEKLNLSYTSIKHLPHSICALRNLKTLELSLCRNLERLPGDIGRLECLEKLVLEKCIQVRDIPDSIRQLKSLKYLSLLDCSRVEKLPKGLELSGGLAMLNVQGTGIRQIPRSISLLTKKQAKSVGLQLLGSSSSSSARKRKIDDL
ncbi:hypothetical protein OSB04_008572 [Centaurea solstitialis]|uniref:TIR domain-containing protein n=1 Tax=Centaurea solstitialis TaxID=347529 RepID=A0AA38U5D8_9ASTR|nr:hypothetical protein OSB04_008572 [Centaurea solstitialis]